MKRSLSDVWLQTVIAALCIAATAVGWSGTGLCAQVTLVWDADAEPEVAGYKVYYGTASRAYSSAVNAGRNTTATVGDLTQGKTYYIAVTAYTTAGAESPYSNEVIYALASAPTCTYAVSPASASFTASGGSSTLSVTTQTGCQWTAANGAEWVSLSPIAGTGSATVACTVLTNPATTARTAALTVAGSVLSVQQAGASGSSGQYTIAASAGTGGSISPSGSVAVNQGGSRSFTITPAAGYAVADVKVDGASVGVRTSYAFTNVTASHTVQATFTAATTYTLSVSKSGTGSGTVTNSPSGSQFISGTSVTLTAAASPGSVFTGWSGACSGTSATCTLAMNASKSVTATFVSGTYTISASAGSGGSISPSGSVSVGYGSSRTFAVGASTGYRLADVKVDGVSVGAVASYTFSNVTAAHTIMASFSLLESFALAISTSGTGSGSVNTSPSGTSFSRSTSVTLAASPAANSVFTGWSGGCSSSSSNVCTLTMDASKSVTATFALKIFTITASASVGGSVTPLGTVTVGYGSSSTVTISASPGYRIAAVLVDGVSVGAVSSYTFTEITGNHTINASFIRRGSAG